MRDQLGLDLGERKTFRGTFVKLGRKQRYRSHITEETILLRNIIDVNSNSRVADHVWFSYTKGFQKIALVPGLKIVFDARVKIYQKGYRNGRYNINKTTFDYKLSHPTKISLDR